MNELRTGGALPPRARIRSIGRGGTPKWLALLALVVLGAIWLGAPAGAQDPCSPEPTIGSVTLDEDEILGSFAVRSTFVLRPRFLDTNGNPIYCAFHLRWAHDQNNTVITEHITLLNVTRGESHGGFYVARRGEATITLTVLNRAKTVELHTESITLQVGEAPTAQAPEPHSVLVTSPLSLRRAQNEFTANALVLDANGATVPDGTPVEWNAIGWVAHHGVPEPGVRHWIPTSVDRTTTNGAASATFERGRSDTTDLFLVTASAGEVVGSLMTEAYRRPHTGTNANQLVLTGASRWSLFQVGDDIPITATLTELDGDLVQDGKWVYWRWHEEGFAIANDRPDVLVFLHSTSGGSTNTTGGTGAATTTYTAAYPGKVGARAYHIDNEPWVFDVIHFNVGEAYPEPPGDLALSLRLEDDSDNLVPTGTTVRVAADLTYSRDNAPEEVLHITEGALRVTGALEWDATSYGALNVPAQSALSRGMVLREHMVGLFGQLGRGAEDGTNEGACKGFSDEGETDWTCTLDLGDSSITVPLGTEPGVYTVSAELTVNGREYRDLFEMTVVEPGSIDEVAEVRFDFAPRERGPNRGDPYPSMIAAGESTRLRLTALNEHGGASAAGSIASVLFTTSAGTLSTSIGGGCVGSGGLSCQIPVSALTASNSDKIDVTLTHPGPGKGGQANVRAVLTTADGETFEFPGVGASLTSAAVSLAISEPATSLLNTATGESDDRDVLWLTVSAADEAGNEVEVPYRAPRAVIRNAAGAVVSRGLSVVWTEDSDDADEAHDRFTRNADRAVQATVRATADPASPLDAGEYTLELRTGGRTATRAFTVVGPPASLSISGPEGPLQVDQAASFTAAVRDADGAPAPDGTPVEWSEQARADVRAVLVQLSADASTTDGVATASYLPISSGSSTITAESGAARDVVRVEIQSATAAAALTPTQSLSETETGGFTTWFGEGLTMASALLDGLPEVNSILLWQYGRWLRYGRVDGRVIPGSVNFRVASGAVLWLGE